MSDAWLVQEAIKKDLLQGSQSAGWRIRTSSGLYYVHNVQFLSSLFITLALSCIIPAAPFIMFITVVIVAPILKFNSVLILTWNLKVEIMLLVAVTANSKASEPRLNTLFENSRNLVDRSTL